jgi:hypothetical protein
MVTLWQYILFFPVITGISRLTLPSGTKGFGGTEGFMAPEIMRYNGEEEYTEKVKVKFYMINNILLQLYVLHYVALSYVKNWISQYSGQHSYFV